jgi:hypothetical protein
MAFPSARHVDNLLLEILVFVQRLVRSGVWLDLAKHRVDEAAAIAMFELFFGQLDRRHSLANVRLRHIASSTGSVTATSTNFRSKRLFRIAAAEASTQDVMRLAGSGLVCYNAWRRQNTRADRIKNVRRGETA